MLSLKKSLLVLSLCCGCSAFSCFSADISAIQRELKSDYVLHNAVDEVAGIRKSVDILKDQLFALDEKEKDAHKGKINQQYREVRDEIVRVIKNIDHSSMNIGKMLQQLHRTKKTISENLDELRETRLNLEVGRKYINQLLLLIYKMERELYDATGENPDLLKIFVKTNSIPLSLVGNDMLEKLFAQVHEVMAKATTQEEKKQEVVKRLMAQKATAQKMVDKYIQEIEKLHQKKSHLISFMKLYEEKKLKESDFGKMREELLELDKSVMKIVDSLVKKKYKKEIPVQKLLKEIEEEEKTNTGEIIPLAWPSYPIKDIIYFFKDSGFEKEHGFQNQFFQIAVEQGTPVYAMRDGVVYEVQSEKDAIHWLMIAHSERYISNYGYLNKILVKEGEVVKRGQLIGYSWGEPGTDGAGFISEKENLTFQIFKDGVAIDPLTILDLSVVQDKDKVLPEEYRLKYLNDQYVRPIDITTLSLLKGENVDARAQNFLSSYAVGVYQEVSFRDEVVQGTHIDRDAVICIGFAESTLGNHLATSNNIGNVGNNDRGDRIAYDNPYIGARMIPFTLNNQYLGHYHTIKQLSRYGNGEGKIYASSTINWQTNVLKCLSKIKGYYIPEDFPFRTGPNPNIKDGIFIKRKAAPLEESSTEQNLSEEQSEITEEKN